MTDDNRGRYSHLPTRTPHLPTTAPVPCLPAPTPCPCLPHATPGRITTCQCGLLLAVPAPMPPALHVHPARQATAQATPRLPPGATHTHAALPPTPPAPLPVTLHHTAPALRYPTFACQHYTARSYDIQVAVHCLPAWRTTTCLHGCPRGMSGCLFAGWILLLWTFCLRPTTYFLLPLPLFAVRRYPPTYLPAFPTRRGEQHTLDSV